MDPNEEQIRKQRDKFIKAFDDIADSTANLSALVKKQIEIVNKQIEVTNRQIEVTSGLIETMMMPKDGMRDVIDEVLEEMRGLREDLRILAKTGGLEVAFRALMGQKPPRGG